MGAASPVGIAIVTAEGGVHRSRRSAGLPDGRGEPAQLLWRQTQLQEPLDWEIRWSWFIAFLEMTWFWSVFVAGGTYTPGQPCNSLKGKGLRKEHPGGD